MEADPSVYHLPASGREEITVFPGTLATTGDKMPTQHSVWEIASASSSFENPLFGRGPCTQEVAFAASGAGFHRQVLHLGQGWVPGWRARTNPVLALPWAVRLQDGLLSARKHPLDCYYDFFFFFFHFVQDFPASRCSRSGPASGSHGSGITGTAAPSDRLSAKLEITASSRSPELSIRVGHWCLDQVGRKEKKNKSSRASSSSFHHL